ncbi:MAG: hypothetical protein JJ863_17935 [Deltaproteobacteria bacterium]|nr:hypothetical protein [Deltaproteobacteria bacterium]
MIDSGPDDSLERFVPDIPFEYDGTIIEVGLEVVGFTIAPPDFEGGTPRFLVAVRNTSFDLRLCALDFRMEFDDSSGTYIALARGVIEGVPHRGVSGTGRLTYCLSPGDVGMMSVFLELGGGYTVEDIASARWQAGAINLTDAVRTSDLLVTDLEVIPDGTRYAFRGRMQNRSSATVQSPQIKVFGVNAVGRPMVMGSEIELISVSAGTSWFFETLTFATNDFESMVAFPQARDL